MGIGHQKSKKKKKNLRQERAELSGYRKLN